MMLNKESLEQAIGILGELTQEQKALIMEAAEKDMPDKELFEKLGGSIDERIFKNFLLAAKENDVFKQELSKEELNAVTGAGTKEKNTDRCVQELNRNIYGEFWEGGNYYSLGFPDCAATVESGSSCWMNDACSYTAVVYGGKKECSKAWR